MALKNGCECGAIDSSRDTNSKQLERYVCHMPCSNVTKSAEISSSSCGIKNQRNFFGPSPLWREQFTGVTCMDWP